MKILVNGTTLRGGGSVQKTVEFVRASTAYQTEHRFTYCLSDVVVENLQALVDVRALDLVSFDTSPARPVAGRTSRKVLRELETRFRPDVVYSVFGPSYFLFRSPHLMGFAVPWVTHPNKHAWKTLNPAARLRHWAWCKHVAFWTRFADRWVLETAVAADGLSRVLGVPRERMHVIPNTCAELYFESRTNGEQTDERMRKRHPHDFNLLVFSHWYPHKRLEMVPLVAAELRRRDPTRQYRFFLTFDTSSNAWARIKRHARRLHVQDSVLNLGPVRVKDGPGLYASSDAVFLPTVLETFTATYPEAMCMRKPIVTTDLPFARDLCDDAALYFPPNDAISAADRIACLAGNESVRNEVVRRGDARHSNVYTSRTTYDMFIQILEITARWAMPPGTALTAATGSR